MFTSLGVFPTHLSPESYPQLFFLHEELDNGGLTSEHGQSDALGRPHSDVTGKLLCLGLSGSGTKCVPLILTKKVFITF